ncbi:MAG: M28 family peptidase [Gemmatimonadetes bacterium]|nr:M28 family peptidase [Gemmatimonadota bacterium]
MMRSHRRLEVALVLAGLTVPAEAASGAVVEATAVQAVALDTLQLERDASVLSADSLGGRAIGSAGEILAARHIAGRLEAAGFAAPRGGHLRQVPTRRFRIDPVGTRLVLEVQGRRYVFEHELDFVLSFAGPRGLRGFSGPLAFVGSTRTLARAAEKLPPVAGQIAVAAASVWDDPDFIAALAERGAQGVILVTVDAGEYEVVRRSRGAFRYVLAVDGPQLVDLISPVPVVVAGPKVTEVLFSGPVPLGSGDLGARGRAEVLEGVLLASQARLDVAYREELIVGYNVVGLLAPEAAAETEDAVVLVAHFDGLGIGWPDLRGDSIYNGFADNAVGVATLLGLADALSRARDRLRRTVIVLASTGEEALLLGAQAYLREPAFPLERTAAVVNLDGIAVRSPPESYTVNGGMATTLGYEVSRIARRRGVRVVSTPALARLDHYAFLRAGVPAISLLPSAGGSDGGGSLFGGRRNAYHRPSDERGPGFSFAGVAAVGEFALDVALHLAGPAERPRWLGRRRP